MSLLNTVESAEPKKIAVYVCHCGGNISDIIDVKKVAQTLSQYPQVSIATEYAFMCSSNGQDMVINDITNQGVNRVVIAACSPALHETTFRNALKRAGLNIYLYEHVNIREQASWVHKQDKDGATHKAIALIKAGVEKIIRQDALDEIKIIANQRVAIVGGGIAGMRAALSCARAGLKVSLFEKRSTLGGNLNRESLIYPTNQTAQSVVDQLGSEVKNNPNIDLLLNAKIVSVNGFAGSFQINFIDLDSKEQTIGSGVIILATGFDHYKPYEGEYAYKTSPFIVTLPDFTKILDQSAQPKALLYEGKTIKNIAFIHCVGSRQMDGVDTPLEGKNLNEYCSRVCCTSAIFTINNLKIKYPNTGIFDIYSDMRTYGLEHESLYEKASKNDVLFIRRPLEERPQIEQRPDGTFNVTSTDVLSWNEQIEANVDMVVLVTGMVPSDISDLVDNMKLPRSTDGFLQEVHLKLRPVELVNKGIYIAGTSQGPMDVIETLNAANTAGVKAVSLLSLPEILMDPFIAVVDDDKCTGCGLCISECSYDGALTMTDKIVNGKTKKVAQVNGALCVGCGACVAVCQPRAIQVAGWTLDQFEAMVDAIAKE